MILDSSLFDTVRRSEPTTRKEVLLGGPQARALQGLARVAVVGVSLDRRGVLDDRAVEILRAFGLFASPQGVVRGATTDR